MYYGAPRGGNPTLYLPHFMLFHLFYLPLPVVTGTTGLYDGYTGYDGASLYSLTGECIAIDTLAPL